MATSPALADVARRLEKTWLFEGLGAAALSPIAKSSPMRSLRKGQVLWKQGEHAYEIAYVWEGQLDVVRRADKRVTFRTVKQNEIIGVSNAMGLTPCTVDIVAGAATRVVLVPGELLRSLVPKHPEIAFRSLDYMGALLGRLSDEVERLHHASLEDRVLDRLRSLSAGRAEIAITHEELAQQVAARRESVSRVISALARRRMIRSGRGRITILDLGHA